MNLWGYLRVVRCVDLDRGNEFCANIFMPQDKDVVKVKLNEVVEALESATEEHTYYLDKRTGEIILLTSEDLEAAEEDDLISEYLDWKRESILNAREVLPDS